MPSPFPGFDPFIEGQKWNGFQLSLIAVIRDSLMPQVRPRYVVDVEEHVYLAKEEGEFVQGTGWMEAASGGAAVAVEPTVATLPMMEPIEVPYLAIRSRDGEETITIIEVLSPTNKQSRDGPSEYLVKRNEVLRSRAHLVELDLLRGGTRLPTNEPLPRGDYLALVSRAERRPQADVYAWALERPLPLIPIPLAAGDPDVSLDLQAAFTTTYDRAGYDYALNYSRPVEPALDEAQREWIRQRMAEQAPLRD